MRSAVVVGAQGVIGRYIVEKFAPLPDWQVVGLSRRRGAGRAVGAPHRRRSARSRRRGGEAEGPHGRHARVLRRLPARFGSSGRLREEHRRQPRPAGELRFGGRRGVEQARARRAGDRHQVLRIAPRPLQDARARGRPAPCGGQLLLRPDRLADRFPDRQALELDGAQAPDALRLRARDGDEHRAGDRRLRRDAQGTRSAPRLPRQSVAHPLSGHRVDAFGRSRALGGHRRRAAPTRPTTSRTATTSAGSTCGRRLPTRSTCRWASPSRTPLCISWRTRRRCGTRW